MGIKIEENYSPEYVTIKGKNDVIKKLVAGAAKSEIIYIATDPDREGEAIAWHIANEIRSKMKKGGQIKRVLFHEITKEAVKQSIAHPIDIDEKMVDAQQARRVMDRIVGYQVSPFLWKTIYRGLSAGRVQTVALRLICEREKEIGDFVPQEFWSVTGWFKSATSDAFSTKLNKIAGKDFSIPNESESKKVVKDILAQTYHISSIVKKEVKRNPAPPFITSTLQQEASQRLRFTAKKTMMVAQQLYEGVELESGEAVGLITYMRTDSVRSSDESIQAARKFIFDTYGNEFVPKNPRQYKTGKSAQDAHEAIRPTNMDLHPKKIKKSLTADQAKLYELVWNRFIASQAETAIFDQTTVDISGGIFTFRAQGKVTKFQGFLAVYEDIDDPESEKEDESKIPVGLIENQKMDLNKLEPKQNFTKPLPRYTEAGLVKELESNGIGRPSTYAGIITTLTDRKYVDMKERKFYATDLGLNVNELLVKTFPELFDYEFTAKMEDNLDQIAEGNLEYKGVLDKFYIPLQKTLEGVKDQIKSLKSSMTEKTEFVCEKCGSAMVIKFGKNGKFLACSNFPTCRNTKSLDAPNEKSSDEPEYVGRECPNCKSQLIIKKGRFGKFIACANYPECKYTEQIQVAADNIMLCPKCKVGHIQERKSKKGKVFFGCTSYPACDFASWDRPILEACPSCKHGYLLQKVRKAGTTKSCPECNHSIEVETPES